MIKIFLSVSTTRYIIIIIGTQFQIPAIIVKYLVLTSKMLGK